MNQKTTSQVSGGGTAGMTTVGNGQNSQGNNNPTLIPIRRVKGRQTHIENEREQQRKIYEENLRRKREQLMQEFEKSEEAHKQSARSTASHNEVKFKYEQDRVMNIRVQKETELANLQTTLLHLQESSKDAGDSIAQSTMFREMFASGVANERTAATAGGGHNFTSIFSKSFYPSKGLKSISNSCMKSKEEIGSHILDLQAEVELAEQNTKNEEMRQLQLEQTIKEIFKSKQKIRTELHDLEFLNATADRRFHDLLAVQYQAKVKKTTVQNDLFEAKKNLREYEMIGERYKEKQYGKMKEGERGKKIAEEIITHTMMRQEEMERENQALLHQIALEEVQENRIIEKRNESKYTLQFIETFTQLEKLFFGPEIDASSIEILYQQNNGIPSYMSPRTSIQNSLIGRTKESRFNEVSESMTSSKNEDQDNRLSFIHSINKFDKDHRNGGRDLIEKLIKTFNELSFRQSELTTSHGILLADLSKKQQEVEELDSELDLLKEKNSFVAEMIAKESFEEEMLNERDAIDSGIIHLRTGESAAGVTTEEKEKQAVFVSTVNIMKMESFGTQNEQLKDLVKANQNFVFNFFSNYCESALRLTSLVELIVTTSKGLAPPTVDSLSKRISSFIKEIWDPNMSIEQNNSTNNNNNNGNTMNDNVTEESNKRKKTTINRIGTQELLDGCEQQKKIVQTERFSVNEIRGVFYDFFGDACKEQSEKFYEMIKANRLIWFFSNIQQISNYLTKCFAIGGYLQGANVALDRIEDLKVTKLGELMIEFNDEVAGAKEMALMAIKETYPEYNPMRRLKHQVIRDNDEIRDSKLRVIQKHDNYFRSQDALLEDQYEFENPVTSNSDSAVAGGFEAGSGGSGTTASATNAGGKKLKDQHSEQIASIVEYVKKAKQSDAIFDLKRKNALEMKKQSQQSLRPSKTTRELNHTDSSLNTLQIIQQQQQQGQQQLGQQQSSSGQPQQQQQQQGHSVHFKLGPQVQQQQQQQQLQQQQLATGVGTVNTTSSSSLYNKQQQQHMQAYNYNIGGEILYPMLNRSEEASLISERARIHNLPREEEEAERRLADNLENSKHNKFFVSSKISSINERLIDDGKHAPAVKEKMVRTFSENQMVLSKVDRLDRIAGFSGPVVLQKIEDEKQEMIRNLRGEIQQPQFNYLKPNETYRIRKQVSDNQLTKIRLASLRATIHTHSKEGSLSPESAAANAAHQQNQITKGGAPLSASTKNENTQERKRFSIATEHNPMVAATNKVKRDSLNDLTQRGASNSRPSTQGTFRTTFVNDSGRMTPAAATVGKGMQQIQSSLVHPKTPTTYRSTGGFAAGANDFLSNDSSHILSNPSQGPYANQNIKFYQRYASPEGDAFFEMMLKDPMQLSQYGSFTRGGGTNRPKTQQSAGGQHFFDSSQSSFSMQRQKEYMHGTEKPQSSKDTRYRQLYYSPRDIEQAAAGGAGDDMVNTVYTSHRTFDQSTARTLNQTSKNPLKAAAAGGTGTSGAAPNSSVKTSPYSKIE